MGNSPKYRLGNQVVVVPGKHAYALYDLLRSRLQRISSDLGELLSNPTIDARTEVSADDAHELNQLSARLHERGFLDIDRDNGWENYSFDHRFPRYPPLRTLSFELGSQTTVADLARMKLLIVEAVTECSLASFAFLVRHGFRLHAKVEALARSILNLSPYVLCQVWAERSAGCHLADALRARHSHADRVLLATTPGRRHEARDRSSDDGSLISRTGWRMTQSALFCRPDHYHLLKTHNESYGCLHVDMDWRLYPDVSELHYDAGVIGRNDVIVEIMNRDAIKAYWTFGKERRSKCADCELRYACPNPLSERSNQMNLGSAPGNCDYDLEHGVW